MAGNATAKVTVKLLDELSRPAQIVRNSLKGIRGDMQALAGARLGLTKQIQDASNRAKELRSTLLGIGLAMTAGGIAAAKVMKPGTDFETLMVDIRQKADMSAEATKKLGDEIKALAPKVNKSAGEVAKGVDFLMGMSNKMTPDVVMKLMPEIGKTATTYRAEVEDLAKSSFAVIDNMKVAPGEMAKALDVMAQAGKEGGFELKDMAREFPSLTAAAEALGIKGVSGVAKLSAALQIARKGAADGSEAATNTANLMQKIVSPETTKKFAKAGVDIRKELAKTQKAGGDPFVMIAELVKKATKGDLSKLGDFFEDAQVQKFLRPLLANLDEYKKVRDTANAANGTVEADFKLRMDTFQSSIDRVSQAFNKLAITVGESLMPALTRIADVLAPAVSAIADWVSANQQLTSNILLAVGATAGLYAAVKTVSLALIGLRLAALYGARGFLNHLAPKGAPKLPGATPSAAPGAVAPAAVGTAAEARPMTPAEIAKAAKGSAALSGPGAVAKVASGLKGGIVGAVVQFVGETAIDKLFEVLPKPAYPAGYDPEKEKNMGVLDRVKRLMSDLGYDETKPRAKPIDPGDYERSRRAQEEYKRDPEGARGRAMMKLPGAAASGETAGAELGGGIVDGLDSARAAIMAKVDSIIADARSKLGAAGLSLTITPKLEGAGASLRGIHSDTGID
uniref:Phage tail tape measure protein n=1 Tax=Bosea sp. NBC_00436 TaxID=2969620 RepID=A0A9E7ZMM5_9HYPH